MTERELFQLAGHLNPVTYPELYFYFDTQPKARIKRLVKQMESKQYLTFTAYEKTGFYITPTGKKWYDLQA